MSTAEQEENRAWVFDDEFQKFKDRKVNGLRIEVDDD